MCRRLIITVCLSLLIISRSLAQGDPNESLRQQKLIKYKNMKEGGMALCVIGGILAVVGGAIEMSQQFDFSYEEKKHNNIGTVLFCSGVVMVGAGIPLTVVGHRKYKYYKRNPDVISLGIKAHPQSTGFSLTYRF
jgi:uncharacterized membrane protein